MKPSPYIIEFHGGRFDGLREPSEFALDSARLAMPAPDLMPLDGIAARRTVYEYKRSTVSFVEQSPVVTFHVHYIGAKIAAPQPKLASRWMDSIRGLARRFLPRPQLLPKTMDDGLRLPTGQRKTVLHGHR